MKGLADLAGLHKQAIVYNERKNALPRYSHAGDKIATAVEPLGVTFETVGDRFAVVFRPGHT